MPKSTPLRAIAVTMLLPATPCGGVEHRLARGHRQVEKEVVVAGDEVERCGGIARAVASDVEQRRREPLEEERRRGGVAVVHLVAHVQRLRHQRLELESAQRLPAPRATSARASSPSSAGGRCTSGPLAPKRSTLPSPSLRLQKARLPCVAFSTIHTGIDGLMMPAIGPTAAMVMAGCEDDLAIRKPSAPLAGILRPAF